MTTGKKRDVERGLQRKGFEKINSNHRKFVYHTFDGRATHARTLTSHGRNSEDISETLLRQMAAQCKLSLNDFLDLVDCELTREDYEKELSK